MKKMNQLQRLVCFIFFISVPVFAADNTLAILDFENNSFFNPEEYQPLAKGLSEMMITELNQVEALQVVERQKLRSLIDELKLSQSGILSEESSVEVGKMLGAQHLVFGSYMVTPDKKIRIDVRIVKVETGLTIKASQVTGKEKEL
ncbi:CsgG/HfaB family protein, partial [bacterium]|nr:CsgG/HfaB family protein [bacterium]